MSTEARSPLAAVPQPRAGTEPADTAAGESGPRRDRYVDGLRALALVRVTFYHAFGWAWLPLVFPSMGVMFALGGSLVAGSLSRRDGSAWPVLRKRLRRLLPPLWIYGAVLAVLMTWAGWTVTRSAGTPITWLSALRWVVPYADPPGSAWGDTFVLPLWYLRTYLWLLLLSPMLLWLFRRHPVPTLLVPAALLAGIAVGTIEASTATGDTLEHLGIFGTCWMLGFAHHDGMLRRLPRGRTVVAAVLLLALGLAYALTHQRGDSGWDIDDIPVANAAYSAGAVLLLLRLYPRRTVLDRMPRLSGVVAVINARAMTLYLWGNLAIWTAGPVLERLPLPAGLPPGGPLAQALQFALAWCLLGVAVLAVGWVEDVAAGRPPRVNPWPRAPRAPREPVRAGRRRPAVSGVVLVGAALAVSLGAAVLLAPATARRPDSGLSSLLPVAEPDETGAPVTSRREHPWHRAVPATVFWVGAIRPREYLDEGHEGQSVASAWDSAWAEHFGGCDGIGPVGAECEADTTDREAPAYFPTETVPRENPYYVGLPFNDLSSRGRVDRDRIPWARDPGYAEHLRNRGVSFLKNRWVAVTGPAGTCYAQVEDTGPGPVDPDYVFGGVRPRARYGINLSPALWRCAGLDLESATDAVVDWRFAEAPRPGPWTQLVTTRQVS